MKRLFLFMTLSLALWLCPTVASAVTYDWFMVGFTGQRFPDAESACSSRLWNSSGYTTTGFSHVATRTSNSKDCYYDQTNIYDGSTRKQKGSYVVRAGDSCPDGKSYNEELGKCENPEPDQCESVTGIFVHEYVAGSVGSDQPYTAPPTTICQNSCLYNRAGVLEGCARYENASSGMDLDSVYCRVQYKGAGSECTTNSPPPGSVFDQPPAKPPFDKTPVYNKDNLCGEWTTASDGTTTRTCTGTEQFVEPGKLNCENSNGLLNCAAGKPAPELSDTKVTETTEKTTKPDGSTDTNTSKTTDKTTCKGTKPCTSTSKTETTTSGTNPDGTPGNETTECTGDNCKPGDEGEGEDEESEEPERSADAGDCDGSFSCEGDPINCAILKKQKEQQCFAEEQADFEGHKDDIEGLVQGDKFELDEGEGDIDVPGFINKGTRFLPASCPPEETVNLITAGGHTFKFSYEPLCRAATDLGNLFVAFALIFAALYVGRSVGGS